MMFYRVDLRDESHVSLGYKFTTSLRAAEAEGRQFKAVHGPEFVYVIGQFHVEPTRAGILHALNLYASHCDNG